MSDETRRNLKRIQEKTAQLEKERKDIQFKIESLRNDASYQLPAQSNQSVNRVLTELKDQQRINEAALTMLRQRLTNEAPNLNSSVSLRSNQTSNSFLPSIYPNNNDLVPSLYDNTLGPEEIR